MMNRSRVEVQVGLALIAALFVLVFGLMWFEQYYLISSSRRVEVIFPATGGLGPGDPVTVRGIDMGKVRSVELVPEGVLVVLDVNKEVAFSDEAVITLSQQGIMGERMVAVEPGLGRPLGETVSERRFVGEYEPALAELMGTFRALTAQVLGFLETADSVLAALYEEDRLGGLVAETTRATRSAADLLERNSDDLSSTTRSLARLSGRVDEFMADHADELGESVRRMGRVSASVDSLVSELHVVVAGTQDVLNALKQQEGLAGRMIYNDEMGQNVQESIEQLKWLVEDLRRNPQRYLTVKVF